MSRGMGMPGPGGKGMAVFRPWGRHRTGWPTVSVRVLIAAQLLGLAVVSVAAVSGLRWSAAVSIGLVSGVVGLVPAGGRCLLDWAATLMRYPFTRPFSGGRATDFRTPAGPVVGLQWDGETVTAVIELLPPAGNLAKIGRTTAESLHRLPVGALAESMTQHDIRLAGIDIISHGYRAVAGSPAAETYDRLVGPLAATAVRTVWLAIRFDAAAETEAVTRRGGGSEGAARTVSVATLRIMRTLAEHGCPVRILTAAQIGSAAMQISRGVRPESFTRAWGQVALPGGRNSGFGIDPRELSTELLVALWALPSLGTTVTVRMRPGARTANLRVAASCRLTTRTPPEVSGLPGVVSMSGRHADALTSNLPGARAELDALTAFADIDRSRLDALELPSSGCGQLIGSDEDGHGIAAPVTGPEVSAVNVVGELYLAQQVVFRAVATGARILIHSDRPRAWESLVESIATPDRLALVADPRQLDPAQLDPAVTAVVFDGTEARVLGGSVTSIRVHEFPRPRSDADPPAALTIIQPGARGDRIILHLNGSHRADAKPRAVSFDLILVTIREEAAFIGRPLPAGTVAATA